MNGPYFTGTVQRMDAEPRRRLRALRPAFAARGSRRLAAAIEGNARLGRRTKELVKHLKSDEVAVVDHRNLDRIAAEELAATGVSAVINASPSSDGTYPNAGPLTLVRAGVWLIDAPAGANLFDRLEDGDRLVLEGGTVRRNGGVITEGRLLEADELAGDLDEQRRRIDQALHDFTENTMAHIREEGELLSGTIDLPETRTQFRDRHVLIVVRGTDHIRDLRALRAYIQDVKPVLVAVDGGVHAILDEGLTPDIVLGDMDSASSEALSCGAELIVHGYSDGRAPGAERLRRLELEHTVVPAAGTSQDLAMLLAFERGASLIVSVGAHFNLTEFLDKQREGMSSTFLTRLRLGEKLVDAKGVSRLYNPGLGLSQMGLFFAAAAVLLIILAVSVPALEEVLDLVWLKLRVVLGL